MPENHRRLAARLQEAFAAFLEHTDAQIGRLVAALEHLGELDNTLLLLLSDNGASQEGGQFGVLHEWKYFNFVVESPDDAVARIDDIGGPDSHTNYPWGWAQAGNTPFKWYKQNTHEGGVHVPLIVHWPRQIGAAAGRVARPVPPRQRHRADGLRDSRRDGACGLPRLRAAPVTGISMRYTLAGAEASRPKDVQYYEMMGHRAIYSDGWKAVTRHTACRLRRRRLGAVPRRRGPVRVREPGRGEPDRLAALVDLWWHEAREHGVLPLDDRTIELFGAEEEGRGGWGAGRPATARRIADRHYVYRPPMSPMPAQAGARIGGRSWDLAARIGRPPERAACSRDRQPELRAQPLRQNDRLIFDYNCFGEHHVAESTRRCRTAPRWSASGSGAPRARRSRQAGDQRRACGLGQVPFVMFIVSSIGPSVGYDHGSPVSDRYAGAFPFAGRIDRVDIQLVSTRGEAGNAIADERATMARQ